MPVRARDLARVLPDFGLTLVQPRGGSSHWLVKSATRTYPLPLHNGLKSELPDVYVRGLCRAFDLDEAMLRERL